MSRRALRRQPFVTTVVTLRAPLDEAALTDVQRLLHGQEHAVARLVVCSRRYGGELDVVGDRDLLRACGLDDLC